MGEILEKETLVHTLKNSRNFILVLKNTGSHLAVSSSDLLSLLAERLLGLICFFMTKNEAEINYVCHTSIENKKNFMQMEDVGPVVVQSPKLYLDAEFVARRFVQVRR